jgi:hypothetical protein
MGGDQAGGRRRDHPVDLRRHHRLAGLLATRRI